MDEYVEGIKSLHIDHLPNIIGNLRQQKNDFSAQLSNLQNTRLELEAKVEPENQAIIKKKLDDAVAKSEALKQCNSILSGKVTELNVKNEQEKKNLGHWVSKWGEKVSEVSRELLHCVKLYTKQNLSEDLDNKAQEIEELQQQLAQSHDVCEKFKQQIKELEKDLQDSNTCRCFLNSNEADDVLLLLSHFDEKQKKACDEEKELLAKRTELEKWLRENKN